ncbi:hypothetical protein MVEN_01196900 [Mycena venus]|uniref:C2H2-type domain-containing protein n=1 Tax=Mycena venus TaxID=2733690 RepID=A0A8H7CY00_9AGAR|nr:hypothetical protein MVEN_01196900 [Mycena venus]
MDTPKTSTPAAQAPSYGISPFAHNPTVKTQPNPLGVPPAQQPVASNAQRPPPASNAGPIPAAPNTTDFKTLITKWQRASPPKSYMDVPDADLRIMKFPSGEIHFLHPIGGQAARIPVDVAYKRVLRFLNSMVGIYVNPKGVNVLLRLPLPPAQDAVYKEFVGVPAKDAPTVIFPTPPPMGAKLNGPAHTGRTPKDADKRFLAHDILRALGKHTFAGDDDRVRYAKRRALEPPEEAEEPLVLQRISSNEPSAKSTSASASSSRSTSPLPAVPVPPLPFQRLPLFMPPDRSVQVQVVQPIPVPVPVPVQQQRVPLFLPSDSSVPPRLAQPKPQPRPQPQPRHRSPDVFVLIPPAPPHVRRDLEKMRARRDQEAMTVDAAPPPKPEPEIDIKELKRQRALGMYQNTENEAEVGAMLEACTRLRENLITHLHEIHAQEDEDSTTCFWDICGESFASSAQLALHAEMHVLSSIPCAYQDCDGVFSSPRELVAHNNLRHAEQNSLGVEGPVLLRLLPSTRLGVPEEASLPLPPVPERVPLWEASYVQSFPKEVLESESGTLLSCPTLAPDVQMPNIPHDRHMSLGPWVARNIAAPALHAKRYNAAHKMKVPYEPDYEFVETSLKHYSSLPSRPARVREMAELKSKEVSELIEKGQIVLWPPEDGAELPFEEEFIVDEKKDELELEEGEERMDGRNAVEEGSTSSTVVEKPIVDEKKDEPEEPMDEKNAVEEGSTSSTVVEKPFEDVALPSAPVLPKTLDEWGDGMLEVSTNPLLAVPSDEEMVENMLQDLEGPSL